MSSKIKPIIIGALIAVSVAVLFENSFAWSQAYVGRATQQIAGITLANFQQSIGSPQPSIGTLQPSIGSRQPSIGTPLMSVGTLQRSIRAPHSVLRGLIFGPSAMFFGIPYTQMLIIVPAGHTLRGDSSPEASEPEPPPLRSAPPVFFIQQCGKYVRVPIPESGRLDTAEQDAKC